MSSCSVSQSPANKAHECCLFRPRPTANWIKFYKHNPENPILPLSSCTATVQQISGHQTGPDLALNMPGNLTPFGCPCWVPPPATNISQLLFVLIPIIRTNGEFSFGVIGFRVIMLPLPHPTRLASSVHGQQSTSASHLETHIVVYTLHFRGTRVGSHD